MNVTPTGVKTFLTCNFSPVLGMLGVGEGVVGEGLLDLDGLTGVDELVDVGRHVGSAVELAVELFDC